MAPVGRTVALAALLLAPAAVAPPAAARVLVTRGEALAEAFPGAEVTRTTAYLTDEEAERLDDAGGARAGSRLAVAYVARRDGAVIGTAYFDTHVVRTLPEVVMVVVTPRSTIERIVILSFDEPSDYLPPGRWLAQFQDRGLTDELRIKRGIRGVTGATLSGRAVTAAARRVLALHELLAARGPGAASTEDRPVPPETDR